MYHSNRHRLTSLKLIGTTLTVKTKFKTTRGPGLLSISEHTVTPTGADVGTEFTYTVSPAAEANEHLVAVLEQNAIGQNSPRSYVIRNITVLKTINRFLSDTLEFSDSMAPVTLDYVKGGSFYLTGNGIRILA